MNYPSTNLSPGSTGADVKKLQDYLVSMGFMTPAQKDTGYGTYGPKTTAAVTQLQKALGVNTNGNDGYFGPATRTALAQPNATSSQQPIKATPVADPNRQTNQPAKAVTNQTPTPTPQPSGTNDVRDANGLLVNPPGATYDRNTGQPITPTNTNTGGDTGGTTPIVGKLPSTGNPALDTAQNNIAGMINTNPAQYQVPANLQITPQLVGTFLSWAHSAVDPQTQQLLKAEAAGINTALSNAQTQYEQQSGQTIQDYGTKLAKQDETAAGSGVAFSGNRGLQDTNLTNTTNRSLASLGANTAATIGNALQTGGAAVGSENANLFNVPGLNSLSVNSANNTGINTKGVQGGSLNYNYSPSIYTAGTIPTSQNIALGNLQSNYMTQYSNLAANNSNGSRSMNDLLGMISGRPAGATNNLL